MDLPTYIVLYEKLTKKGYRTYAKPVYSDEERQKFLDRLIKDIEVETVTYSGFIQAY